MVSRAPPPSSRQPAGVPSGGSAKFIVAAVVLIGLIGAAVGYKMCQGPGPIVTMIDAAPPPTFTVRNPDDDIPPPPVIPDASTEDAGKRIIYTQTGNQCDAKKCGGTSSSELETALNFRVKQSHRCYDTALANDPTLKGKVTVAVRVGANGLVCSAGIASNEMGSPMVANCVAGYFRGANFPSPKGGCADINIPINFVPRQ